MLDGHRAGQFWARAFQMGFTYGQVLNLQRTGTECENYETKCMNILKQVFDEGQHCAPCPNCDTTAKGKLIAAEDKLRKKHRTLKDLAACKCDHF